MSAVPVLGSAGNPGPQNPESKAQTNLIVNYLPQSMSEDDIKNLFSSIGPIQSCKLIKDKTTQVSLGYSFVNYHSAADAEKAIQNLNGLPLQQKMIKVSYARPSSTAIKNANLYVAYLPKDYTQVELEALFRPFGSIITSKILVDTATGLSRGVGFIRFDKRSEAELAIDALNGKLVARSTQPLLVKFANQPSLVGGGETNGPGVVGSHVPIQVGGATRRSGAYGSTVGGPIRHTLASVRYNPVSALSAPAPPSVSLTPLPGLPNLQTPTAQGWCVFVYNLPENTQDHLLYQLFSPYGAISSVKVIRDTQTLKCKRFGFVNMMNYEEAYRAIVSLNGYELEGKPLQVSFKTPKS